ncbi:hypothetical protein PVL29_002793 [Vitis rotundifolia]|uniref:Dirigent protein n=1 Tax=Vitis rotundifolia TaxID=103349 RepID=A0AA39ABY8_VITRO|nr:hypothetical protein PVL29_002793 [Vitis rotundifolia]
MAMAMPRVHSTIGDPEEADEWLHKIQHAKQKVTRLHFYFHDTVSGQNVSAMRVTQASITDKSPSFFGLINMIDDPLTEGPELTSKQVGRAQGLYGLSGLNDMSLLMVMNFAFTSGEYNGSTLSILGMKEHCNAANPRDARSWWEWGFPTGSWDCNSRDVFPQFHYG